MRPKCFDEFIVGTMDHVWKLATFLIAIIDES
jgi:hypothetical protein